MGDTTTDIRLPNGNRYAPQPVPDLDALRPLVTDLGDGTALVTFVERTDTTPSDDPVAAATHVLRAYRHAEAVFTPDLYNHTDLSDALETSGDNLLDRVVFIRNAATGPGVEAVGRKAPMDDWEEFKSHVHEFDAAVVLPRTALDEYPTLAVDAESGLPIRDYTAIAEEINAAAAGRWYTVVHQRVHMGEGRAVAALNDTYDDTLFDPQDASARAEAQHQDLENTLELLTVEEGA